MTRMSESVSFGIPWVNLDTVAMSDTVGERCIGTSSSPQMDSPKNSLKFKFND
jgi:hypothetical protein